MRSKYQPPPLRQRIVKFIETGPHAIRLRIEDDLHRYAKGVSRRKLSEITPHLHVGGQHNGKGYDRLLHRGITAIVNMREEEHSDEKKGIGGERHLHLPTIDHTPPSINDLKCGVAFISREIEQHKGRVYIHCRAGCGRAPSMAAAYLISTGMTRKEALRFIKKTRPFIDLNKFQLLRLDQFEADWRDSARQPSCPN